MPRALYDIARDSFLLGTLSWAGTVKITLTDAADYTVNLATHDFYNDVPAAARVAESADITPVSIGAGVADATDGAWTLVTGDPSEAIVGWKDTAGTAGTDPLIFYDDLASGLPITPNGQDINFAFDAGANRVFKLVVLFALMLVI